MDGEVVILTRANIEDEPLGREMGCLLFPKVRVVWSMKGKIVKQRL